MLSALAIVGRAMNLTKVTRSESTVLAAIGSGGGVESSNINLSRSTFGYDPDLKPAPFFYINRVTGITGGGGGGGTASPTASSRGGGGGKAGKVFEIDVKLHLAGKIFVMGGAGGVGGGNGSAGAAIITPEFKMSSSDIFPLGGAGGDGWVGGGALIQAGEKSEMTPVGDGGDGAHGLGDGNGFAGKYGKAEYRGLVW